MAAFKVPLKIDQGADYELSTVWKAGPLKTPVDLTGCSALAHVRSTIDAPTPLLTLSTANGGIVLGGTTGSVKIIITRAQTEGVAWRSGVYDLEVTMSDGKRRRLMYGSVSVSPEVTRG